MQVRVWLLVMAALCGAGCPRPLGGVGSSVSQGSGSATLQGWATEGGPREDRVGANDAPTPDGQPDAVFEARVSGRVSALILTVCDDQSIHTSAQWDTVVGQTPLPQGFMHRLGTSTRVLGVVGPEGRLLNNADGSLPEQNFERPTSLRLFASITEDLQPGRMVCLTVLRPDGSRSSAQAELR